jgi:hypothetical protein
MIKLVPIATEPERASISPMYLSSIMPEEFSGGKTFAGS